MSPFLASAFGDFNSLWTVVVGAAVILVAYHVYAKRIDRAVVQADERRTTPARTYVDRIDFIPTSRVVLFAYHSKSIATAGAILGVVIAAQLWGWLPALLWLVVGVSFIGWVSDYTAVMLSVRNEGNSLPAISQRLISPRSRTILFSVILVYLLLMAGAFVGIVAGVLDARPDIPFALLVLAVMGLVVGWLIYERRARLVGATVLAAGTVILAMALGPLGATLPSAKAPVWDTGVISGPVESFAAAMNSERPLYTLHDPTGQDPRINRDPRTQQPVASPASIPRTSVVGVFPSYILWAVLLLVFGYFGATLPIRRFAQPVNYIGFWVTALIVAVAVLGAVLAPFGIGDGSTGTFSLEAFRSFAPAQSNGAVQPIWPLLFVTIGCGAVSGWHAIFGSFATGRQLEYETDALPVVAGGTFSEHSLALVSLVAVAITGAVGIRGFAVGMGSLLHIGSFGVVSTTFGTALGFSVFVVIAITVLQVVVRIMRITLVEWLGERWTGFKNHHIATVLSTAGVLFVVLSGSWIYLWQLFGASNQMLAALSLLIVSVWLTAERRSALFAGIPMVFMFVTASAAAVVTAWNLVRTIGTKSGIPVMSQIGGWTMALMALALVAGAGVIAWDAYRAWARLRTPASD
jgi:carbon starvation protein